MGLLYWTGGKLSNCRIRVVYKMRDFNDNSGVFIRIPLEPREEWVPVHYGYEVKIDNHPETSNEDEYHITGTLYSLTRPLTKPGKPGPEWNTMVITLDGPRTTVVLNDVTVTDYTEGQPVPERKFNFEPQHGARPNEGYIGLQNHSDHDIVILQADVALVGASAMLRLEIEFALRSMALAPTRATSACKITATTILCFSKRSASSR